MKRFFAFLICSAFLFPASIFSQCTDSSYNNLVHPAGFVCAEWGTISFEKIGKGKKKVLFLPGWGFCGRDFRAYFEKYFGDCTVYLLTLPGYGGTAPYPMPAAGESYGAIYWMKGVEKGVLRLLESEGLQHPVLIAHFSVASHIALHLAARHPGKFKKIALVGAPAWMQFLPPKDKISLKERVQAVDGFMAEKWFKTVTPETWRKGNFIPATYALDAAIGNRRFEEANSAPLPVQIRYLCEYWAADYSVCERVQTPVLSILPSFSPDLLKTPQNFYMDWHIADSWQTWTSKNKHIQTVTVEKSACNIMDDRPEELTGILRKFLFKQNK